MHNILNNIDNLILWLLFVRLRRLFRSMQVVRLSLLLLTSKLLDSLLGLLFSILFNIEISINHIDNSLLINIIIIEHIIIHHNPASKKKINPLNLNLSQLIQLMMNFIKTKNSLFQMFYTQIWIYFI